MGNLTINVCKYQSIDRCMTSIQAINISSVTGVLFLSLMTVYPVLLLMST